MVLKGFGSGLKDTFRKIARMSAVDKASLESVITDLQRTLLQGDVDVSLVHELSNRMKKSLEKKPPAGMTLREYFLKTLYDEMVGLLGKGKGEVELKPQRILAIGLFASGKTTTCGKLAKWFKTRGLKSALVACDTHRAAAQEQIRQIGKSVSVPAYWEGKKPEDIAKNALKKAKEDVLIFDSAGRNALDKQLAKELKNLGKIIKPDEVFLVMPADIGQAARKQAEEFNKLVGITGIIITKLDGTAKGGGALAAASVSGARAVFIGTGEKMGDIEAYDPDGFFSRLVGYGDIKGLLEKARDAGIEKESVEKIVKGDFTLDEFCEQIESIQKMGSLSKVSQMIPGMSGLKIPKDFLDVQEDKMKKWRHIVKSMTAEERQNPETVKHSRVSRISKGSGSTPQEVKELLKHYRQIKKIFKMTKGGKGLKRGPLARLAKQLGMG